MGLRWVQWQQAMLVIVPVVLLIAYVVRVYLTAKRCKPGSVLPRLVVTSAVFTIIWLVSAFVLFNIAWMGTSNVTIDYDVRMATYEKSIGWSLSLFYAAVTQLQIPRWLSPLAQALPIFVGLLLIGALVAMMHRLLATTRFAVERNVRLHIGALVTVSFVVLLILLWPQPSRNPEMPSVPIPEGALAVTYAHTADEHRWPTTSFGVSHGSVRKMLGYYHDALQAGGWTLEFSEAEQEGGPGHGNALFSLNGDVLEMNIASGYSTYVNIEQRRATSAELAQLAALPNPTPTPTLEGVMNYRP